MSGRGRQTRRLISSSMVSDGSRITKGKTSTLPRTLLGRWQPDEDEFDEFRGVYGSPVIPWEWRYCQLKGGITRAGDLTWGMAGGRSGMSVCCLYGQ